LGTQIILFLVLLFSTCLFASEGKNDSHIIDSDTISFEDKGLQFMMQNNWDLAFENFTKALHTEHNSVNLAMIHQNIGCIFYIKSCYQEAALHFAKAIALSLADSIGNGTMLRDLYCNMASTYLDMRKEQEAEIWLDHARNISNQPSINQRLRMSMIEGALLYQLGHYSEALQCYKESLTCDDPMTMEQLWIEKNIACCYLDLEQYDMAHQVMRSLITRLQSTSTGGFSPSGIPVDEVLPELYYLTGYIYFAQGAWQDAWTCFDQADNLVAHQWFQGFEDRNSTEVQHFRFEISKLLAAYGLNEPGNNLIREKQAGIEEAFSMLGKGEQFIANKQIGFHLWINRILQITLYDLLINRLWELNQQTGSELDKIFALIQRSRRFQNTIHSASNPIYLHNDDSLNFKDHPGGFKLFRIHKQLMHLAPLYPHSRKIQDKILAYPHMKKVPDESKENSKQMSIETTNNAPFQVASLNNIQAKLNEQEALIALYQAGSMFYVLFVTSKHQKLQVLPLDTKVQSAILDFSKTAAKGDFFGFSKTSKWLFHWLMSENYEIVKSKSIWYVFPDQTFSLMPLDALLDTHNAYLIEKHQLIYHKDFISWMHTRDSQLEQDKNYSCDFYGYSPYIGSSSLIDSTKSRSKPFLTESGSELNHLAQLFSNRGLHVKIPQELYFDEDEFLRNASEAKVIHLALHGEKNQQHPECSGWILSDDPQPSPLQNSVDGKLEVGELKFKQFNSFLLALSSCPAGTEQAHQWHHIPQVPFGFLDAGVEHILFSRWNVSDYHTRILMERFYQKWLQGCSLSEALQMAKISMIRDRKAANPIFWASWMLWGK
jgi:CHAT domain-containing protein/Tfp pilus assembly protein PilF